MKSIESLAYDVEQRAGTCRHLQVFAREEAARCSQRIRGAVSAAAVADSAVSNDFSSSSSDAGSSSLSAENS